jgi:L-seryl-tRNA(Ser) seleniumtransferase
MSQKTVTPAQKSPLAGLPAVDRLLAHPRVRELSERYPKAVVKEAVRGAVSTMRREIVAGRPPEDLSEPSLIGLVERLLVDSTTPSLRPVINATGIILHTNLGRAPLAKEALDRIVRVAGGYSTLEYNVETGERGSRHDHLSQLISSVTGAEAGIVVNNNAAAVLIALNTLADTREVIVSRGELVEIGGAFRIPDVMAKSGAHLHEVGTTNRTRLSDYESAVGSATGLLLKVHTSNFRIVGFVEEVPVPDLVALGKQYEIPVMVDLGSGSLIDLSGRGLPHEPTVRETVKAGADVVTFSGDKLLGGAQAGFIVGNAGPIERIKKNPLARAVRVDKLTIAAVEATLMIYRDPVEAEHKIPVLAMVALSYDETKKRAGKIARMLAAAPHPGWHVATADDFSGVGGGAFPTARIPTRVVTIASPDEGPEVLLARLRKQDPPIAARIADDRVIIDPRTVMDSEFAALARGILSAMAGR